MRRRAALCALVALAGCKAAPRAEPAEPHLLALEAQEQRLRAATDWASFPSSDATLGPDPVAIAALADGRFAGVLRGADAVVLLDAAGRELARAPTMRAPRAIERVGDRVIVSAVGADDVAFSVQGDALVRATVPAREPGAWRATLDVIGHQVTVRRGAASQALTSDGPPWGVALRPLDDDVLVAVGMIEDRPLDRTGGSFGHIDSFLRVHRVSSAGAARLLELNLSEHGIVTPKALAFLDDDTLLVAGAGSGKAARVRLSTGALTVVPCLPGVVSLVPTGQGFIGASPLLDAWVVVDGAGARAVAVPAPASERTADSRLGEALVFTTIMAPRQQSAGALSRFTCEACHFEGGIDGRVHHTGRGDVRATTRPLLGLFNNTPLFTRAMDPNVTRMVHAEFRVANANSSLDPWFALTPADAPWLALLGVHGTQGPVDLRRGLMTFLRDFTPRTNPRVVGKGAFTDEEARGAALFRDRCVACHAARLIGDDARSEEAFHRWEPLVLQENGPIVWSSAARHKTGIEPYVHEEGARPSSLRRVSAKRPYFTNGSSPDLDDVLLRARGAGATFQHAAPSTTPLPPLDAAERAALKAFLVLL